MAIRNRLRDNPVFTPVKDLISDGCHFQVRAKYFPTGGVEYHIEIIRMDSLSTYRFEVKCVLKGGAGDTLKLNRATKATIYVSSNNVRFEGIPQAGQFSGFASCGVEQISMIREIDVLVEGFKKI